MFSRAASALLLGLFLASGLSPDELRARLAHAGKTAPADTAATRADAAAGA